MRTPRRSFVLLTCLLAAAGLAPAAPDTPETRDIAEPAGRRSRAGDSPSLPEGGLPDPRWSQGSEPATWLGRLWRDHRRHILTVFLLEQADYYYEKNVGPPDEPRLFGSPSGLDRRLAERYSTASGSNSFIAANKSALAQLVSAGAIAWAHGSDWEGVAGDVVGLIEAHKINWTTSSLVKNIVGRRRPSLESTREQRGDLSRFGPASRNSFPSDAASSAFTYMAYTDSVLARRLGGRPALRALSAVGLYGLAGYVAFTRLEQGKHYLSDVVAGAGAGFLVGKSVYRMNHDHGDLEGRLSLRLRPLRVPGGAGVLLTLRR